MTEIRLRRVHDPLDPDDGFRILVDRLWPRGISKDRARVDLWARDVAPSTALRTWWNHDPERFGEFADRYRAELDVQQQDAAKDPLAGRAAPGCSATDDNAERRDLTALRRAIADHDVVTFVFAARDRDVNHAPVLAEYLRTHP